MQSLRERRGRQRRLRGDVGRRHEKVAEVAVEQDACDFSAGNEAAGRLRTGKRWRGAGHGGRKQNGATFREEVGAFETGLLVSLRHRSPMAQRTDQPPQFTHDRPCSLHDARLAVADGDGGAVAGHEHLGRLQQRTRGSGAGRKGLKLRAAWPHDVIRCARFERRDRTHRRAVLLSQTVVQPPHLVALAVDEHDDGRGERVDEGGRLQAVRVCCDARVEKKAGGRGWGGRRIAISQPCCFAAS